MLRVAGYSLAIWISPTALIFRHIMGRFHQSMLSWNHPTESGDSDPGHASGEHSPGDLASDCDPQAWSNHQAADWGVDGEEPEFNIDANSWSHLTSHRSFFLPLHYTKSYKYPLVVWLHSNGFNENQVDHVMPHISLRNYVGVGIRGSRAADSIGHRFDWHASPAGIAATHEAAAEAIEDAADRFSINRSRIIIAGYQDGGTMALRIAMRQPDRFAGAISLGGRMPQGAIRNVDQLRERRLPMLWQWGLSNRQYAETNLTRDCRSVMTIGGQVEVRQYPGDDEMDTVVLRDIDEWIMRRIVSNSSIADSGRWSTSPTLYSNN